MDHAALKLLISIVFLSSTTLSEKLTDNTNANYISILDGDAVVWEHYGYLTHYTNLTMYSIMNEDTKNLTNLFPQSHMRKIIDSDIMHIETLLRTVNVHHRQTRSLNFLGTTLKIIAGTPDFDDFQRLQMRQDMLVASNNKQYRINTHIQQNILEITDKINQIIATT
uniref:Retrovirus-related Env polyprotein from transposon gypsy n=2 Tax=Zeugodacus cucurbitae TaxID=28588 RepID=A0A0A1XQH0_ZEUCU